MILGFAEARVEATGPWPRSSLPLLKLLSKQQRGKVAGALTVVDFDEGAPIIKQGEKGDVFYLVRSGEVMVVKDSVGPCHRPVL